MRVVVGVETLSEEEQVDTVREVEMREHARVRARVRVLGRTLEREREQK